MRNNIITVFVVGCLCAVLLFALAPRVRGQAGGQGFPITKYVPINIATGTTVLVVTGVAGHQVSLTSLHMVASAADNVAVIEGTGATCNNGTAGMAGGATAATGYNFAANGGISLGNGSGIVMQTATAGDSVCLITSATAQLSGGAETTIF